MRRRRISRAVPSTLTRVGRWRMSYLVSIGTDAMRRAYGARIRSSSAFAAHPLVVTSGRSPAARNAFLTTTAR